MARKLINRPGSTGWAIFRIAPINTLFSLQVQRVDVLEKFDGDQSAQDAARQVGVPCDQTGFVDELWTENHYRERWPKNF